MKRRIGISAMAAMLTLATCQWVLGQDGVQPAAGGGEYRFGPVQIPADSPLARSERPRLLVTRAQLTRLRQRVRENPVVMEDLKRMEAYARHEIQRFPAIGAAAIYAVTGDARYKAVAMDYMDNKPAVGAYPAWHPFIYDLLYEELTPEQRRKYEHEALTELRKSSPSMAAAHVLALWGSVDDPVLVEHIHNGKFDDYFVDGWSGRMGYANWYAGTRGGSNRSFSYTSLPFEFITLGVANATGMTQVWDQAVSMRYMSAYFLYHLRPQMDATLHIGVNCDPPAFPPRYHGENAIIPYLASHWQDGVTQWWEGQLIHGPKNQNQHWFMPFAYWGRIIWRDYDVPEIPPTQLPPDRYFDRMGYVSMRSAWGDEDATMAHFQSGPFENWDSTWGRNNADNNSFIILSRGGVMAADTGTRLGNHMYENKPVYLYFNQTVAHNSITVGDDDVKVPGAREDAVYAVRGGQVVTVVRDWLRRHGETDFESTLFPKPEESRLYSKAGQIAAYASAPQWVYSVGDATRSYSPDYVKSFVRHFLYLRPDVFVVFDRVESAKPDQPVRWLLHTMDRPDAVNGTVIERKPGYFSLDGDTLAAVHADGKLFCQTLLPKPDDRNIEFIGGEDHRYEVNGINRDMPQEWYDRHGVADQSKWEAFRSVNNLAEWRVEVTPTPNRTVYLLLHVLSCADREAKAMVPCRLVETADQVGVELTIDGKKAVVMFNRDGQSGGTLTMDGSQTTLPNDVEDNYDRWATQELHRFWMTSPYLRNLIGAEEQDRYERQAAVGGGL